MTLQRQEAYGCDQLTPGAQIPSVREKSAVSAPMAPSNNERALGWALMRLLTKPVKAGSAAPKLVTGKQKALTRSGASSLAHRSAVASSGYS